MERERARSFSGSHLADMPPTPSLHAKQAQPRQATNHFMHRHLPLFLRHSSFTFSLPFVYQNPMLGLVKSQHSTTHSLCCALQVETYQFRTDIFNMHSIHPEPRSTSPVCVLLVGRPLITQF